MKAIIPMREGEAMARKMPKRDKRGRFKRGK